MHRNLKPLTLTWTLAFFATLPLVHARTWTSAKNGKTLEAEFVELTETAVVVQTADGKKRSLPLDFLIEEDLAEARKLQDKAEGYGEPERPELPDDDGPVTLTVSGFHLCCAEAAEQFTKAVGSAGSVAKIDKRLSQATVTAPSSAEAQKAVDALTQAGFHGDVRGKEKKTEVKFYVSAQRDEEVKEATIAFANPVCCAKMAENVARAIGDVPDTNAAKAAIGAYDLKVEGSFNPQEILESLRAFGYRATLR